jgi:hypothetical protein
MLNAKRLGVSGGIIWGLCMFICTILALLTGYSVDFLNVMRSVYPGYSISWGGAIVGLIYGFADGFAGFFLLAWIYNKLKI